MPTRRKPDPGEQQQDPEKDRAILETFCANGFWGAEYSVFEGEEEAHEYWRAHRDRLLAEWIDQNPGQRPSIWWELEAPRDKPVFAEDRPDGAPPHLSNEASWLHEFGELSPEERAAAPGPSPAEVGVTDAERDPGGCW